MTVKDWLSRGYKLDNEINALLEAQQKAFSQATNATSSTTDERVQATQLNTAEMRFLGYASYSEKINKRIDDLYCVKLEIQEAINKVDDNVSRILLIHRYINFKTWEQIAVDLNYTYEWVIKRLHPQALKNIKEFIVIHIEPVI